MNNLEDLSSLKKMRIIFKKFINRKKIYFFISWINFINYLFFYYFFYKDPQQFLNFLPVAHKSFRDFFLIFL